MDTGFYERTSNRIFCRFYCESIWFKRSYIGVLIYCLPVFIDYYYVYYFRLFIHVIFINFILHFIFLNRIIIYYFFFLLLFLYVFFLIFYLFLFTFFDIFTYILSIIYS